jgi:hypothetical protein
MVEFLGSVDAKGCGEVKIPPGSASFSCPIKDAQTLLATLSTLPSCNIFIYEIINSYIKYLRLDQ